jgi:glycosyltransferase involved in cell wall biosynthesis
VEVVVVDDGSVPPAAEALAGLPVTVLRHERAQGVSAARNAGIAAAKGDWVAFLDDDDLWAPDKLRRQLDAADAAGAGFAYAGGVTVDGLGRVLESILPPPAGPDLHRDMLTANVVPFACSNVLARTELVRALDGFDQRLSVIADWDLVLRLSARATGVSVPESLVAYTHHGSNMHSDERRLAEERDWFVRKHAAAYEQMGVRLDEDSWLRWRLGARQLSGDARGAGRVALRLGVRRRDPRLLVRGAGLMIGGRPALRLARRARRARAGPPGWPEDVSPPGTR